MLQLEGPTVKIHSYVPGAGSRGGFGEKKKKKKVWQQMLAQVPILKKNKNDYMNFCSYPKMPDTSTANRL